MSSASSPSACSDYVVNTLLVPPALWRAATTPTVEGEARLCHLQSLLLFVGAHLRGELREGDVGGIAGELAERFREALPADSARELAQAVSAMVVPTLLQALHDFALEQLTPDSKWDQNESLKLYLGYSLEDDPVWFEMHFPESLRLAHAAETYAALSRIG